MAEGYVCVSVIFPVYNAGEHLDEALESIAAQTILNERLVEVSVPTPPTHTSHPTPPPAFYVHAPNGIGRARYLTMAARTNRQPRSSHGGPAASTRTSA